MKEKNYYDNSKEYEEIIMPKILELQDLFRKNDIPFMIVSATINNEETTHYEMTGLMPGVFKDVKLTDNRLKDIYQLISGYAKPDELIISNSEDTFPDEI